MVNRASGEVKAGVQSMPGQSGWWDLYLPAFLQPLSVCPGRVILPCSLLSSPEGSSSRRPALPPQLLMLARGSLELSGRDQGG